tara:strand:+ start:715 stop:1014 length:300 start_codon:yes stop_codon:yes gene_type:complete
MKHKAPRGRLIIPKRIIDAGALTKIKHMQSGTAKAFSACAMVSNADKRVPIKLLTVDLVRVLYLHVEAGRTHACQPFAARLAARRLSQALRPHANLFQA